MKQKSNSLYVWFKQGNLYGTWNPIEYATEYRIEIQGTKNHYIKCVSAEEPTENVLLCEAKKLIEEECYTVEVFAVLHMEAVQIQIPNRRERLNCLRERILSGRENMRYVLNAQILEDDNLICFLKNEYCVEQIFVESQELPQLDENIDMLYLGTKQETRQVCFWIDDSLLMQMAIIDNFFKNTKLQDIYRPFAQTEIANMWFHQSIFCRSTAEKNEIEPNIQKGRFLQGTFSYCMMRNGFQESCIFSQSIQAAVLLNNGIPILEYKTAVSQPIYFWLDGKKTEFTAPMLNIQYHSEHHEVYLQGNLDYKHHILPATIKLNFLECRAMEISFAQSPDTSIWEYWPMWLLSWTEQGNISYKAIISYHIADPCKFMMEIKSNKEVSLSSGIFLESWKLCLSHFSLFQGIGVERTYQRELSLSGRIRTKNDSVILLETLVAKNNLWKIRIYTQEGSGLLETLMQLIGFDIKIFMNLLPKSLSMLQQMDISDVILYFDSEKRQIQQANFTITQSGIWELIDSKAWMEGIKIQTQLNWQESWKCCIKIVGCLVLKTATKEIRLKAFLPIHENITEFSFYIDNGEKAVLSLKDFFAIFKKENAMSILPNGFCEFGNPSLQNISMKFEIYPQIKLRFLYFVMTTQEEWVWLPANLLSLKSVKAYLCVDFREHTTIWGEIYGIMTILQQDFMVSVNKNQKTGWEGKGKLIQEWDLSLPQLSNQFGISIPEFLYKWGLAKEITVFNFDVCVRPEQEWIALSFASKFDWTFGIGPIKLCFQELFLDLIIEKQRIEMIEGSAGFVFCGFSVLLKMEVEQSKETLRFWGKLEKNDLSVFSLEKMANSFVDDENKKSKYLPIPSSFIFPIPDTAEIFIDIGLSQYAMVGNFSGIGTGGFASVKNQESSDYILAFALAKNFLFSNIIPTLGILDQLFQVENAGLLLSTFYAESIESVFSEISCELVPKELTNQQQAIKPGLFLYGTFRFSGILEKTFCLLTGMETSPNISVAMLLPKEESETTVMAELDNFSLFGIISFQYVKFLYTLKDGVHYRLQGTVSFNLFGMEYIFSGFMDVKETQADFCVKTVQEVNQPFGIPRLTIKNLELAIHAEFSSNTKTCYQIFFQGSIAMGNVMLDGKLHCLDGKPQIFILALSHKLDFNELLQTVLTQKLWPSHLLDITVSTGEFYYAEKQTVLGNKIYESGMHIESQLCFYGLEFQISGHFSENTVSVSGTMLKPVSLGFAAFTDYEFHGNGPSVCLEVSDTETKLGLSCGLVVFGENLAAIPFLGYDFKSKCFVGTAKYQGDVKALQGTISFTWDEKTGFEIQDWPMHYITDILDYAKLFEIASTLDSSGCAQLTNLIFEKVVHTDFSVSPSFNGIMEDGTLSVSLLVSYKVQIAGQTVVTSSMPCLYLNISMPEKLGFSELWNAIFSTITNNAVQIAKNLLEHVDQLGKFFAVMGVVKGSQEVFNALVCRGVKQGIFDYSQIEVAKDMATQAKDFAGKGSINYAAGAAAHAESAAAAASSGLESSKGFFAVLGSIFVFTGTGENQTEKAEKEKQKAEEGIREAKKSEQEAREAVISLLQIQEPSAQFLSKTEISVQWRALDGTGIHYQIAMWQDGKAFPICETETNSCQFTVEEKEETKIQIQIQAILVYEEKEQYIYKGETQSISLTKEILCVDTPQKLPTAKIGQAYYLELKAHGGQKPYQWHVKGLPEGIYLKGNVLSGTPTIGGGQVPVEIILEDAFGNQNKIFCWIKVEQE